MVAGWAVMTSTVGAVLFMFSTFATADDIEAIQTRVDNLELSIMYGQYYDRLDDFDKASAEGNEALAKEYQREMERLKAKICEADPEWERCN